MSGYPEQEYFADGMTDDIITELSRFSDLFVIARNSSFQYKGKAVDVRRVGRELGVRYERSHPGAGTVPWIRSRAADVIAGTGLVGSGRIQLVQQRLHFDQVRQVEAFGE